METSEFCVYTIVHGDLLADSERSAKPATFKENTKWATGYSLWRDAQEDGKKMVVLFADATDCSRLIYWGVLTDVSPEEDQTKYTVDRVLPLSGRHKPQDLVLR